MQKELNESQSDTKEVDLFRGKHTPQAECEPSQKVKEGPWTTVWLILMGWVISWTNAGEDYSNYLMEGVEISKHWATTHILLFDGQSWSGHRACGSAI